MSAVAARRQQNLEIEIDPARVRLFKDQPRKFFDLEALDNLAASIGQRGQLVAGMVKAITGDPDHDYELVDGERRWRACTRLKCLFRAVVIQPVDIEDQYEISAAANFQRQDHTPMEISRAIERICTQGNRSEDYVASLFGFSGPMINQYRRYVLLHPDLQPLIEPSAPEKDRLALTVASQLARFRQTQQPALLRDIRKKGMSPGAALEYLKAQLVEGGVIAKHTIQPAQYARNVRSYIERTIRQGSVLIQALNPELLPVVVASLHSTRKLSGARESITQAIKQLEALHAKLAYIPHKTTEAPPAERPRQASGRRAEAVSFVYSHPMKCPKCLATATRFRRRSDALGTDYWICQLKGCQLRVSHYNIRVDRNYSAVQAKGA